MMMAVDQAKQMKRFYLETKQKVSGLFLGDYQSAFHGQGLSFQEFREYVPGDDIRHMAWNLTAKLQKPFVKIYQQERNRQFIFVLDVSASMTFSSKNLSKQQFALNLIGLLSLAAIRSGDHCAFLSHSEQIETFQPMGKSEAHWWKSMSQLNDSSPVSLKSKFEDVVSWILKRFKKKSVLVWVSDFETDEGLSLILRRLAKQHELILFSVKDPMELHAAKNNPFRMTFKNLEHGDVSFGNIYFSKENHFKDQLIKLGIDCFDMQTDQDLSHQLQIFMRERESKFK